MDKVYKYDGEFTDTDRDLLFSENPDAGLAVVYVEHTCGREFVGGRMQWIDRNVTKAVPFATWKGAENYIGFLNSQANRSISDLRIEYGD